MTHGGERSTAEQQQRYHKYLSEIESLQERIRRDQIDYERKQHEYHEQIDRKQRHVDQLKMEYVKLVKEIASKAVFARTGKTISNQVEKNEIFPSFERKTFFFCVFRKLKFI